MSFYPVVRSYFFYFYFKFLLGEVPFVRIFKFIVIIISWSGSHETSLNSVSKNGLELRILLSPLWDYIHVPPCQLVPCWESNPGLCAYKTSLNTFPYHFLTHLIKGNFLPQKTSF